MAITGRTAEECFERFREHIARLVRDIVPTKSPIRYGGRGDRRVLSFANTRHKNSIPLETNCGTVFLHIAQSLRVDEYPERDAQERCHLRTVAYWYKLFGQSPGLTDEAALRWEYATVERPHNGYCHHHLQLGRVDGSAIQVPLANGVVDLNRVHVPTGWILIEEVFRFLIHELDMRPPSANWAAALHESETAFFERFTSKRHDPPKP